MALDDPPQDASAADIRARYGLAYLAVRRLAERFGESRMLMFFAAVARDGLSLESAAESVLGVGWDDVAADCAQAIRSRI